MSKRWRAIGTAAAVVAGMLGTGYYWLLRRPLAKTQGTLRLEGLQDRVEVLRDRWGVPHIYARTIPDLMFAQGYVHAQDRLWQMESWRRTVSGRLSEVMGERTVPVDRWLRTLGMRRVAEQEVDLLEEEARAELEAYAAGVTARIAQGRFPIEFALLRYRPEPWSVADSLSWIKMMSWGLSVNWESELLRAQLISRVGPDNAAELDAGYADHWPLIVPSGLDYGAIGTGALDRADQARAFTGPPSHGGVGSNNWVVAGSRTTTGSPLLANDMHLPMSLPSIWYENHLVCGDLNITGITFAGIPYVVSGHNGRVAWGFTNGFPDVQDLYIERLRYLDGGRVQYEFQGEWLEAEVIQEEIEVKGSQAVTERVIVTHHGPIINSMAPDFAGEEPLSLRWTSLEPDTMIDSLRGMVRAKDCLEFREALRLWAAPVQNMVYADVEGNIAYSYPGKVPIRARGDGRVPVPGWTGEYEWQGYIPFEELPHLFNPDQGAIATANNQPVDDNYPHFLGREFAMGDRIQRITNLLDAQPRVDAAWIRRMHTDLISPSARLIAGYLGQVDARDSELAAVVDMMRQWDGELAADSPAAAVYQVFVRRMIYVTLSEKLGDLVERYAGRGPTPMLAEGSMFGSRAHTWLLNSLGKPNSHWFDLGNGETRDEVMRLALRETVDFLKSELGPSPDDWAWGKLHTLSYNHLLGAVKPLDRLFNRGPYPLPGDATTVWATGANRHDLGCETIIGPPFRFIADLGDLTKCRGILVPGQSGQPGCKHYDDQIQAWFDGEYHPMLYAREDVAREAEAKLELLPF